MESLIFRLLEFTVKHLDLGGGGGLPCKSDTDALQLAFSVKSKFWSQLGCLEWKVTIFAHSAVA